MALRGRIPVRPDRKPEHRINDMIRVPRVRLVDENGAMVGEVDAQVAKNMAREKNLDLVEVAPDARPPPLPRHACQSDRGYAHPSARR